MSYSAYPEYKDSGIEWLGEVPVHWEVLPFFSRFLENRRSNKGMVEDNLLSLSYGRMVKKDINTLDGLLPESFETYQIIHPDDIIFRLTDLQNDKRSLRSAISKERGIITSAYLSVRARDVDARFSSYLFRAYDLTKVFYAMGGGLRQSMKYGDMKWIPVLTPPESEQIKIATFLDHETARIDALVEEQQRLIELLKEKRQAVISHAVTKGLDPNVPMKDSGVEWLGEVPVHWDVVPLKYLVTEKVAGPYGASLTKAMYTASGYKVYGQQQVIPNDFSLGDYYISQKKFEEMSRYQIFPGDVLFSVMGTVGKVAVVPPDAELGIINPRLVRYKFAPRINPYFLRLLVMSQHYQASLQESAQGSTMEGLNMAILGDLPILLPSREEQNQIVTRLSQEGFLLEELVNQAKYAMSLLSERRSALISAAVTGKIDVRGWQPPLGTAIQKANQQEMI